MGYRGRRFCRYCRHFVGLVIYIGGREMHCCGAYPNGIPFMFLQGQQEHLIPFWQDNNIVWQPKEGLDNG